MSFKKGDKVIVSETRIRSFAHKVGDVVSVTEVEPTYSDPNPTPQRYIIGVRFKEQLTLQKNGRKIVSDGWSLPAELLKKLIVINKHEF